LLFHGDTASGNDPIDLNIDQKGFVSFGSNMTGGVATRAPYALKAGAWYHIAGTINDDGGVVSLYINGLKVDEKKGTASIEVSLDPAMDAGWGIGNHSGVTQTAINYPFKGSIDDVRLYNRVLTPLEIGQLYMYEAPAKTPMIITQPVAGVVGMTGKYTFSVTAIGNDLMYQWRKNGINIDGANSATYSITSASNSDAGSYDVVVSNGFGASYSSPVTLTLSGTLPPPIPIPGGDAFYVTKQGNDLTGDGSLGKPFLTISKAVATAPSGARILVGAGTYSERVEGARPCDSIRWEARL
jgi:hypothetical protein